MSKRRRELATRACELLSREGPRAFGMRALAREVGMKLASLQHHFPNREALLWAMVEVAFEDSPSWLDLRPAPNPTAAFAACVDRMLGALSDGEEVTLFLYLVVLADDAPAVRAQLFQLQGLTVGGLTSFLRATLPDLSDAERQRRAILIDGVVEGIRHHVLFPSEGLDLDRLRQEARTLTLALAGVGGHVSLPTSPNTDGRVS